MASITASVTLTNIVWGFSPQVGIEATTVSVTATGAWTLTSDEPWLRLAQTSGTGNATVVVSVAEDDAFPQESTGNMTRPRQGVYTATLTLTDTIGSATCLVSYPVAYGDLLGHPGLGPPSAPIISSLDGLVTLAAAAGTIYYTTDGSEPTVDSLTYIAPFTVPGGTIVQAIAVLPGQGWSPIAIATITVVVSLVASAYATASGGTSATTPAIDSTGCTLLTVLTDQYFSGTQTLADSKGNTWQSLVATGAGSGVGQAVLWYCLNPTVGTGHTVTVSDSSTNSMCICVAGWKNTSAYQGGSFTNTYAPFSSGRNAGNVSPSQGDLVLLGFAMASGTGIGWANGVDSGATLLEVVHDSNLSLALGYLISPNGATVNPTWSVTADTPVEGALAAVFKHA